MAKYSSKQLAVFACDQLASGKDTSHIARSLSAFMLENRMTRELPAVLRTFERELMRRGNTQVVITSAHEITEAIKQQLASLLGIKTPKFSEIIDPSVIGGVKAQSGERIIDLTVRGKLQQFKASVVRSAV